MVKSIIKLYFIIFIIIILIKQYANIKLFHKMEIVCPAEVKLFQNHNYKIEYRDRHI